MLNSCSEKESQATILTLVSSTTTKNLAEAASTIYIGMHHQNPQVKICSHAADIHKVEDTKAVRNLILSPILTLLPTTTHLFLHLVALISKWCKHDLAK